MPEKANNRTILDFDGTLTDVEKEGAPFGEKYQAEFAKTTGLPIDEVQRVWEIARAEILSRPGDFGWKNKQGLIVTPATADPYVIATAIAQLLFDKLLSDPESLGISSSPVLTANIPTAPDAVNTLLDEYFGRSYAGLPTVLQPGVAEFLNEVNGVSRVTIVGNAKREKLLEKLGTLHGIPEIPVIGKANKGEVNPGWTDMPESMQLPGLVRPVWLRRKQYHEALTQAGALEEGVNSCAVGDIWELDLALPENLGLTVGLMERDTTPPYEGAHIRSLQAKGRAMIARTLEEMLPQILKFHS